MIGTTIIRTADGVRFNVTGHHEGRFILAPSETFDTPLAVAHADLLTDFDVQPGDLAVPPSEADVLRAADAERNHGLNERYARAVAGKVPPAAPFTPPEGSPEATFAKVPEDES